MGSKKDTSRTERSNKSRRDTTDSGRRKSEDPAVKRLLNDYEIEEERTNEDRRHITDRRHHNNDE